MNFCIINCLCLILSVGIFGIRAGKIVGGVNAKISDYPYQTSVRFHGKHFCGGSIIGKKHILTAAHCVENFVNNSVNVNVYTGTSKSVGINGDKHRIKRIHVHSGYLGTESSSYRHDIAILTLTNEIKFNANQTEIELPTRNTRSRENVTITGWGIMKFPSKNPSVVLQKADMKIIPNNDCLISMPLDIRKKLILYKEQLCAFDKKGVGICSGDSGSPLVADNQVIGIASFVIPCGEGYPDVYTNVYPYVHWIKTVMDKS